MVTRWTLVAAVAVGAVGCSDALEQTSSAGQVIGVSDVNTLSLISAGDFTTSMFPLINPGYTDVSLAGRESVLLVLRRGGLSGSSVYVIDLAQPLAAAAEFILAAPSPGGAIQNDSIAWVAISGGVARVNYRTHNATTVPLGGAPQAVVITAGRVFVVNTGSGASWLSVVDPTLSSVVDSIPLSGADALAATVGGDSLMYVVEAAPPDGKVSIVDPVDLRELVVINGLGDGAGPAVFHPSGRLLIASAAEGILEINTLTTRLTRGPGAGVKPGGHGVSSLTLDNGARVYATDAAACGASGGLVHVLGQPPEYREIRTVSVTACPSTAATAERP